MSWQRWPSFTGSEVTVNKIPFVDLFTEKQSEVLDSILSDIKAVVSKSEFILGNAVGEFEKSFARVAGCENGVGVNSGLDALILSLRALKIGEGDEVITAPNSFVASAAAIALVGAKPVFVDVAFDYNLDPDLIETAITSKTKAIMPVHLTGNPCQMDRIESIAKKHQLKIVEDAAQAIGATFKGKAIGSWSDLGAFSLHPLKNLHVWGDGGMITCQSGELEARLRLERNHGLKNRDEVEFFSYNSRLDTIQAVVGLQMLRLLPETTESRIKNAMRYREVLGELEEFITLPPVDAKAKHVYHVFQVRAKRRDELKTYLAEQGIDTKVHYPIPIHHQKAASYLNYRKGMFPVTEQLATEILSVPVRENLTQSEQDRICEAIKKFYR